MKFEFKCEFCGGSFGTKKSLTRHQKGAKYCLKLRETENSVNTCDGCNKRFLRKFNLNRHLTKCNKHLINTETKLLEEQLKESRVRIAFLERAVEDQKINFQEKIREQEINLERIIEEQKLAIKNVQEKYHDLAKIAVKKSSTTNNNNNIVFQNLVPLTDDHIRKSIENNITKEHILAGAPGYAKLACEHTLKDRAICTDVSRKKVRFKNRDGQMVTDAGLKVLTPKIFRLLEQKTQDVFEDHMKRLLQEHGNEILNFDSSLAHQVRQVKEAASGVSNPLTVEFSNEVCSRLDDKGVDQTSLHYEYKSLAELNDHSSTQIIPSTT